MRIFGLIGYPLGHSWSARFFNEKFRRENISDAVYKTFPIESIEELPALLQSEPELAGLNVTIPYKQQVIHYLDALGGAASKIRAVNTIRIIRKGNKPELIGYNTDVDGFRESLAASVTPLPQKALVLGTGGASKAVCWVLKELGCEYRLVSRKPSDIQILSYDELDREVILGHSLIINTTPLGMMPNIETCPPIPYQWLNSRHLLFDLVYNPPETLFLKRGKAQGCKTLNGEAMLTGQALRAWEIWNR
ncbi:MAG: shikimate dehydrogenase [Bacteroidales bacterium]|jgi:shikimate dehydrogenase|nr:shikimate dehydrogenase [Bacteroidales bacterium]